MKIFTLSNALLFTGIVVIITSIAKFIILTDFTSMAIVGSCCGLFFISLAYFFYWKELVEKRLESNEKRINAFSDWFTRKELS